MKTAGIIAEYNPFHNGHRYQIETLRARTGADYVVVAMSGDFVQRGEPAIYDKYTRTYMALSAGADLVLELPAAFATSSAEDFAACGVALFDRIGIVDMLCFGSECGDIASLEALAQFLIHEPAAYASSLKEQLRLGDSFPKAREYAICKSLKQHDGSDRRSASLLSSPNNILGIEYMKALLKRECHIQPYTIQRYGKGYHETEITVNGKDVDFASASAIRQAIHTGRTAQAMSQMPVFPDKATAPIYPDDLSSLLNYRLLQLSYTGQDLTAFSDVSPELADRLQNQLLQFSTYTERIQSLKTRQYTYTRISRALLHLLLGITDFQIARYRCQDYALYARILGFRRDAAELLTQMKKQSSLPLITKTADAAEILSQDAWTMFQQDLYCSHIYQAIVQQKSGTLPRNEYNHSLILL